YAPTPGRLDKANAPEFLLIEALRIDRRIEHPCDVRILVSMIQEPSRNVDGLADVPLSRRERLEVDTAPFSLGYDARKAGDAFLVPRLPNAFSRHRIPSVRAMGPVVLRRGPRETLVHRHHL